MSLVEGLVVEIGRAQAIGRPALFATTPEFLQQFGLTSLEQLPGVSPTNVPAAQKSGFDVNNC